MTVSVLMVAEKPSLARSLAQILSNGQANEHRVGGPCPVLEYHGSFQGQAAQFSFTSVTGHVMTTDFPARFNNWDAVKPIELFDAPVEKKEANSKGNMERFLRQRGKGVDYLVLWLDCDREGENICFEVMDCVVPVMNKRFQDPVYRAKFSAITATDIKRAMNNLGRPNLDESLSVDARQELDLRLGCAFTRFQTRYFQGKYGDLDASLVSFGPCQTPTLGLCVDRHDKIQSFQPETYWTVSVTVAAQDRNLNLEWGRGRVFDKEAGLLFLNLIQDQSQAVVTSVTKKEKSKPRPLALNTVELMRMASSGLGMGPAHAMQIAERLYTQGYISYPRTETTSYSANFDIKGVLQQQKSHPNWGSEVQALLRGDYTSPKSGKDVGDHPPITPSRLAREGELSGDMWRVYDLVTRHFIATVSPDCKYLTTKVNFTIGNEEFSVSGHRVISKGFTSVLHWLAPDEESTVPEMQQGEKCMISASKLAEKRTSPPGYLTESELISLMEKHGIGTDASIPVHINNICERNYVEVKSGRTLVPTPLGIVLVHGYYKIDPDLVMPTMRAAVEKQLDLIANGKADYREVLLHANAMFRKKFDYFMNWITSMDELFQVSFSPLSETGKPLSRCGQCHRFMKYIAAKPSRLHCPHCDQTYSMPQNGKIMLYKEIKCPLDGFELVLFSTGSRGQSYPVCPYCYNNPPFEGMKKNSACNQCTHPTCKHSMIQHSVCPCIECETGNLILDPNSAPKWKMACNICNVVVLLVQDAHRITATKEECECGCFLLDVDFNKKSTPLPNGATKHMGCVFCDKVLSDLIKLHHAVGRHPMYSRGRRGGKGRGKGRGRGRGRGRGKPKDKMSQLDQYFL